jgi:acetyl-CoA acyltransferase
MPEAEQGLNVGRLISLMGLKIEDVPGVTVNRYCASGLENHWYGYSQNSIRMALYCAGGAESMTHPDGWLQTNSDYAVAKTGNEDYYWGMGLTADGCTTI